MVCNNCGTPNPDSSAFCNRCGQRFQPPSAPQFQANPQPQGFSPDAGQQPFGIPPSPSPWAPQSMPQAATNRDIGGAMVLLTIYLVFLNPAYRLWVLLQGWVNHSWAHLFQIVRYMGFAYGLRLGGPSWGLIFLFLYCASAAWGANAGIKLWGFQPGAVGFAKTYFLIGGLLLHLFSLISSIRYFANLAANHMSLTGLEMIVLNLMFLAIEIFGYLYLSKSSRVAAAYPLG